MADMPPPARKAPLESNADFRKLLETPRPNRGSDGSIDRKAKQNSEARQKKKSRPKPEKEEKEDEGPGYRYVATELTPSYWTHFKTTPGSCSSAWVLCTSLRDKCIPSKSLRSLSCISIFAMGEKPWNSGHLVDWMSACRIALAIKADLADYRTFLGTQGDNQFLSCLCCDWNKTRYLTALHPWYELGLWSV